jgi:hypothetical protein
MARRVWSKNGHGETLGSAGNWGFPPARPMPQQFTVILDVSRLAPSQHILCHQMLQIQSPPSYILPLGIYSRQRGQHIQLEGRLYYVEPSPDSYREAIACGNHQCIYASYSYDYITGSVFKDGRFPAMVRTADVVGIPILWRGQRIKSDYTHFNSGRNGGTSCRLI